MAGFPLQTLSQRTVDAAICFVFRSPRLQHVNSRRSFSHPCIISNRWLRALQIFRLQYVARLPRRPGSLIALLLSNLSLLAAFRGHNHA